MVRDEDVERAEAVDGGVDGRGRRIGVEEVEGTVTDAIGRAEPGDEGVDTIGIRPPWVFRVVGRPRVDEDRRTGGEETLRHGVAYPRAAAHSGDEGDPAGQRRRHRRSA